jgi:PAS domain-containing protein
MSQQNFQYQQQDPLLNQSTGSTNDYNILNFNINPQQQEELEVTKSPRTRRDSTNYTVERLYKATLIQRPGERDVTRTGGRKNKNEILGLALARLIKEKHLNGNKYSRDIELLRGIQMKSNRSDFVLVLRLDGRIVAMSDEVEQHLGKSMRSLYTQCINIFQCLDETDGDKLRLILDSSVDLAHQEHRLVCTLRLPKGKRPSRTSEDIKTITMAGHFYSCDDSSSVSHEKLFIARCEALISRTTNGSSSSTPSMIANNNDNTSSMVKMTLNEDMSISVTSSNVKDILGYSRNEMIGNWLGRYLTTNDLEKFEAIRQKYFQHQEQQQRAPTSICDIFDMYTNNGDGRLTFLFQIRPIRERRSKSIKFSIVAQLIDPSLRSQYVKYVESELETSPKPIKVEQVNHVSSSLSKTSEDTIVANSPSLDMGLLMSDATNSSGYTHQQQHSPSHRSLSNVVAPVNVHDQSWRELFDPEYDQYSATTDFQYWSTKSFDDVFIECQSEQGLANIFDEYLDGYYMGGDCC